MIQLTNKYFNITMKASYIIGGAIIQGQNVLYQGHMLRNSPSLGWRQLDSPAIGREKRPGGAAPDPQPGGFPAPQLLQMLVFPCLSFTWFEIAPPGAS